MVNWDLKILLESLHGDIQHKLTTVRQALEHPVSKGDGAEKVWVDLFNEYLPERYRSSRAFVVDSNGQSSEQLDVVIYDRQYSPLVFNYTEQVIIPAESVYAVFEVKQSFNKGHIAAAARKVSSVRSLHRTTMPIPHAGGLYDKKKVAPIFGGLLALENELSKEQVLRKHLMPEDESNWLSIGCASKDCFFYHDKERHEIVIKKHSKATTAFLFQLLSQLQSLGTVPMLDIHAYGKWLED